MTKAQELQQLGQSIWYDNMRRALLESGEMQALIDQGICGVTSNPTIFDKAIAGSDDYDAAIAALLRQDKDDTEIYEALVFEDIRRTADLLRPVYDASNKVDGYVSLEVSPDKAHDSHGTVQEAKRFFAALERPNVMIKVPATAAGVSALRELIGVGINVNVTLMFSLAHYEAVAQAYIDGLEDYAASGGDVSTIASVASFFISRVDAAVDARLEQLSTDSNYLATAGQPVSSQETAAIDTHGKPETFALRGQIAIANAKQTYQRFQEIFSGSRWQALADKGARVQRPLWASTSTKNPDYPDTLYVDSLIAANTVNTLPPATLAALQDHATVEATLEQNLAKAHEHFDTLASVGIDFDAIAQDLQDKGITAFADSFRSLMESLASKREQLALSQA